MSDHPLDSPKVIENLFYPRKLAANTEPIQLGALTMYDGTVSAADGTAIGYRLYAYQPDTPLVVFFHAPPQ